MKKKHILMVLAPVALVGFLAASNVSQENAATGGNPNADLVVSRIIIERTAESIAGVYGKKYWVAVVIKNAGTTPVTRPFNVTVKAPGYESGDVQRTNRKFQPNWARWSGPWLEGGRIIMPGEEIGAAWLYPVYLRELATYEISAVVDSSSEIRESDENNNTLTKHFETYMAAGGIADVRPVD